MEKHCGVEQRWTRSTRQEQAIWKETFNTGPAVQISSPFDDDDDDDNAKMRMQHEDVDAPCCFCWAGGEGDGACAPVSQCEAMRDRGYTCKGKGSGGCDDCRDYDDVYFHPTQ